MLEYDSYISEFYSSGKWMIKNLAYCLFTSHLVLKRRSSWYSCVADKMSSSFPNSYSSSHLNKHTFHHSPSSNSFSNMSFGTGRVYIKSQNCLVLTVGVILLSLIFLIFGMWSNRIEFPYFKTAKIEYGIMIDAGSTGSRVHVYRFISYGNSQPVLQDEVFEQVKPGLSSYADRPVDGVKSIESLLDIARRSIPEEMWMKTPLALKATAGLRLLPAEQSKVLLEKVYNLFDNSPFKIPEDPVAIMDGKDEGIYAWLTVNYLLSLIGQDTVGTIDLGGGSMQITFSPVERKTIDTAPDGFIQETSVFNNRMQVYVHSYLGLGLMSSRELVLGGPTNPPGSMDVTSPCMPNGYSGDWKNAQSLYHIKGETAGSEKFDTCHEIVKKAIAGKINRPDELKREDFYAFSYYFDRAAENGLIHPEDGGLITVSEYESAARKVCSAEDFDPDSPFMCLDLTIITTFLQDGFGFPPDMKLQVRKKIKGKENSWALGGTFFLMTGT
uniref:ectonucleoside triphosphate diphosphohydrolase 5-like isoform X2 n=1 Tax=Styela clava TaxID=7725 RepID=UPI00193ADC45|nr:ectonucleoside triphosphate diphosphohydrolase 5-like isoform X2 [Styela clava]